MTHFEPNQNCSLRGDRAYRDLQKRLFEALVEAQEQRPKRSDWIEFERNTMFEAVNHERRVLGKDPLDLADIERVETFAQGHSDYTQKFALYCAELVRHGSYRS